VYSELTELDKACRKPELLNGFVSTYEPLAEDGERLPPEQKQVQYNTREVLQTIHKSLAELFNTEATKDFANKADIVVDGTTLMAAVPTTFLLFCEKQLKDLGTMVERIVELDTADEWRSDENDRGIHVSAPSKRHRTKKLQKGIVLYPATVEHPAQTQLITEDQIVGYVTTVKRSGAIPRELKRSLLRRIEKLTNAVKSAREEANTREVVRHDSSALLDYVFAEL
jgi:predicted component of type VI protein secretion system